MEAPLYLKDVEMRTGVKLTLDDLMEAEKCLLKALGFSLLIVTPDMTLQCALEQACGAQMCRNCREFPMTPNRSVLVANSPA